MPPKKRLRGPRLPTVREEDSFRGDNESDDSIIPENADLLEAADDFNNDFNNDEEDDGDVNLSETVKKLKINKKYPARDERFCRLTQKQFIKLIIESMRICFQSRDNVNENIIRASQKLLAAYKRANVARGRSVDMMERFFMELDARLSMMVEEVTIAENRARVFKMVAICGTELMTLKFGDEFLKFILDFIGKWGNSENVAARINTTCFISYILETGHRQHKGKQGAYCGYSLEQSAKLFLQMKRALYDREHTARVPAIRGLGVLQGIPIPSNWPAEARDATARELLLRSCRDISWECRLVAVQSINPTESDVKLLSDIVYYDKCLNVRVAALERFQQLKPNKFVKDKVHMLDICFKDHEVAIRDAAKEVLKSWVKKLSDKWSENQKARDTMEVVVVKEGEQLPDPLDNKSKGYILSGQALSLLWLSDTPETIEYHANLRRMITHTLDVIRQMYVCHAEPINTFADVIIGDLREKMLENAVPIVTKSTIGSLLEDSELLETQDASTNRAMIFFWRCVVDYLADRKRNEADKINALSRFVSPLKTMVDHLEKILQKVKNQELLPNDIEIENYEDHIYILQMSMVENALSVMKHTQTDQSGQDAYKELLISMLMNVFYQKKIINLIAQELAPFYTKNPDDLFSLIYARTNEMKQKFKKGVFPILENSVLIGETKYRKDMEEEARSKGRFVTDKDGLKFLDLYELKVLNAVMKTDILKEWDSAYENRYGTMLRKSLTSDCLDTRILATECFGIIGTYNFDVVEDTLGELLKTFKTEEERVQGAIIEAFTDNYIQHGDRVDELFCIDPKQSSFPVLLSDIIISDYIGRESLTLLYAVEAISRLLLNQKIDPNLAMWQRAMVTLMFRASYALTDQYSAKVRSMIIVMLKFFCSLNRNNQTLVIKSFRRFFDMWANTSNTELFTENRQDMMPKLKRCAQAFVALTRHSILPMDEQKKYHPTHVDLVDDILHELAGSADSTSVDYYLCALNSVEYSSFQRAELMKIHGDLDSYISLHQDDDDKHRYNELKRASRKVAKIAGINEDDIEEEIPNINPEPKKEISKGRRNQSKDQIPTEIAADIDSMEADEMEDDDRLPSTSSAKPTPQRKPRAPRATPASVSKKKPSTDDDVMDILKSPPRNPRKPPSRPASGNRPTATPSTRTAHPRSARKLRSDK